MATIKECQLADVVECYYDAVSKRIVSYKTNQSIKLTVLGSCTGFKLVGWKRKQPCSTSGFKISDQTLKHSGYTYISQLENSGFTYGCWLANKTEIKGKVDD